MSLYLGGIAVIGVWTVPLIIALLYDLPRKGAIAVLSLALVWTGVAWLAALVIAVAGAIRAPARRKADSGASPATEMPRQRAEPVRHRPEGTPRQVARQPERVPQAARQPERVPEVPLQRSYAGPPPETDERPPRRQPDRPERGYDSPERGYDRPPRRASDGRHQR